MEKFLLAFLPVFVAIDVFGAVPMYIGLTDGLSKTQKKKLCVIAIVASLVMAIFFLLVGKKVMAFLGITVGDFRVAGGVILLVLSINDLLFSSENRKEVDPATVGVVPIAIPLIVGPALITTLFILVDKVGYVMTSISLLLNLLIVFLCFLFSDNIMKIFGKNGSKGLAKIMNVVLAAYAVMMIREGILQFIK